MLEVGTCGRPGLNENNGTRTEQSENFRKQFVETASVQSCFFFSVCPFLKKSRFVVTDQGSQREAGGVDLARSGPDT
jgi:hypothetical protein